MLLVSTFCNIFYISNRPNGEGTLVSYKELVSENVGQLYLYLSTQSVPITTIVGSSIPVLMGVLDTTLCDKVCQ